MVKYNPWTEWFYEKYSEYLINKTNQEVLYEKFSVECSDDTCNKTVSNNIERLFIATLELRHGFNIFHNFIET